MFDDGRSLANSRRLDIAQAGLPGPASASGNPYLASWLNILGGGQSAPRIESGIIVDTLPGGYAYRVSAGDRSFLWCSPGGTAAGFGSIGARQLTTYAIGTPIFFIRHHQTATHGTIVAAEPPWMLGAPEQWPADGVWPFIRSGQKSETSHYWPVWEDTRAAGLGDVKLGNLDLSDFSAGRPMDATSSGEWGAMAETGLGFFLDSWQVYLRVDESTGVFGFYQDQLLRVSGHNFQFSSSHTEHEELEDEGELTGWTRTVIFPWEAYGAWRPNQVTPGWAMGLVPEYGYPSGQGTVPNNPLDTQGASGYAVREPESPRALPASRINEWQGYLGQGGKTQISAPVQLGWAYPNVPAGAATAEVAADLADSNSTPGGRLLVNSASGLHRNPVVRYKDGSWNQSAWTYHTNGSVAGVTAGMWISLYVNGTTNPPNGYMLKIISAHSGAIVCDPDTREGRPIPTTNSGVSAAIWANPAPLAIPVHERGDSNLPRSQPGVFEDQKTIAGKWMVRAVGGIYFTKKSTIPAPRPNRKPEDPAGDNPNNYSPSGIDSDGNVTHFVKSALDAPGGVPHRMVMLPDSIAYAFNWEGMHPFAYHTRDWVVEEEGNAGSLLVNQRAPNYSLLEVEEYLAAPAPAYLDIDHRYGNVAVYETESTFAMTDDGSIVLADGWGSEIRMGGGNIELHCSGDIRIFNGRNLLVWSGHDIDLKAQDSLDLVADRGDLRTQAGRNSQHMAGLRGCGGFLFETKAVCPSYAFCGNVGEEVTGSGFVVLAPNSQVWLNGQDVVMTLEPTHKDGRIVLNAGTDREIHTNSKRIISRMPAAGEILHLFGHTAANEFTSGYTILSGKIHAPGNFAGSVVAADPNVGGRVSYLAQTYATEFDQSLFTPPGSECAEYTARTAEQYLATTFTYWQSKWKSIAEGDGQTLPLWDDSSVVGLRSGTVTRAHPGERWTASQGHAAHPFSITDPTDNWLAIPRSTARAVYENPVTSNPYFSQLQSTYTIPFEHQTIPPSPPPPPPAAGCCAIAHPAVAVLEVQDGSYAGIYRVVATGTPSFAFTVPGLGSPVTVACVAGDQAVQTEVDVWSLSGPSTSVQATTVSCGRPVDITFPALSYLGTTKPVKFRVA